jgi:Spy/CpxP family protein refolding chaperone
MKFKTVCSLAVLSLSGLMVGNALAQAEKKQEIPAPPAINPETRPSVRADRLADLTMVLKLSEEQRVKIKPIVDDESKQIKALREDRSLPFQERGAKFREIRKAADEKIKAILTPEQAQQYDKRRGLGVNPKPPAAKAPATAPVK